MFKKIISGKVVHQGNLIPKGYGISYWSQDSAICHPLVLNKIVRACWLFYGWLKHVKNLSKREDDLLRVYQEGFEEGFQCGWDKKRGKSYFPFMAALNSKEYRMGHERAYGKDPIRPRGGRFRIEVSDKVPKGKILFVGSPRDLPGAITEIEKWQKT